MGGFEFIEIEEALQDGSILAANSHLFQPVQIYNFEQNQST